MHYVFLQFLLSYLYVLQLSALMRQSDGKHEKAILLLYKIRGLLLLLIPIPIGTITLLRQLLRNGLTTGFLNKNRDRLYNQGFITSSVGYRSGVGFSRLT